MFKQSSIQGLQQQIAQLEILEDDQLNALLEQLENQKAKLPIEDHPIIDWGINLIRVRIREEEQVMREAWEKLEAQYSKSYRDFVKETGWEPYNKDKFRTSLKKHLQEIVVAAFTSKAPHRAQKYAHKLRNHLSVFCGEEGIVYGELIDGCESFCIERFKKLNNPDSKHYNPIHADCYKYLATGLKDNLLR